jgi:hypothetical protein
MILMSAWGYAGSGNTNVSPPFALTHPIGFGCTLIATQNKELNHSSWHKEITPLPSPIIPGQTNAILKVMVAIGIPCYN